MRGLTLGILLAGGFASSASLLGSCGGKAENLPTIVDTAVRDAVSVSVNDGRACALHADGSADCWGDATGLGVSGVASGPSPKRLNLQNLARVLLDTDAPGAEHGGCVLHTSGAISCWGPDSSPAPVALPVAARAIDVRLTILSDGRLFDYGPECKTQHAFAAPPREVVWARGAVSASGWCAILADQSLWCADGCETSPSLRAGPELKLRSIHVEGRAACALNDAGRVYCFGDNSEMQCGVFHAVNDTATRFVSQPKEVVGVPDARLLFFGNTTCIAAVDGTVWCWGRFMLPMDRGKASDCGSPGVGCTTPIEVPLLRGAKDIAIYRDSGCAVMADGHVMCWGDNYYGQLGQ